VLSSEVQATVEWGITPSKAKPVPLPTEPCRKVQLKSQAAMYPLQESMALLAIGDKIGMERLRDEAIADIRAGASMTLKSSNAMHFFWEFFKLPQEGAQQMRPHVMALAAEDVHKLTISPLFQDFVTANPVVVRDLVNELGNKISGPEEGIFWPMAARKQKR
jgi:hypothetical protein